MEALFRALHLVPVALPIARQAGLLEAELGRRARPAGLIDLLIACTAIHEGGTLVTANPRDLDGIPGLQLIDHTANPTPP